MTEEAEARAGDGSAAVADPLNAVVAQRVEISPDLIVLRVVPDGWELPDFDPGQFAVLGLPGSAKRCSVCDPEDGPADPDRLIRRAYSIASSSRSKEFLEFYVALVGSGRLTPRLFALKVGHRVWVGPKFSGLFTLDEVPADKHIVMISTGTGLAPYMSMLRTHLTCGGQRRLAVLHGARHSWDLGYRAELMTLDRLCGNFTYAATVSRPAEESGTWHGPGGYVQELWSSPALAEAWGGPPSPDDTHVFLCGNPSMIEDMVERLGAEGFREHTRKEPGEVHVERYW
jgi:ferredoxin--NADP+ reductase